MEEIYKNIKILRMSKGYSQQKLAELVGYRGKSMIAKIEKGLVDLPIEKVTAFAQVLGCSESDLMGWSEVKNEEIILSDIEKLIILKFRTSPHQNAILSLLGITDI